MYKFFHSIPKNPLQLKSKLLEVEEDITFFDADRLICERQLGFALERAEYAFRERINIASTWGLEVLLELSGQHQIKKALEILEITEETRRVIIVTKGKDFEFETGLPELQPPSKQLAALYEIPFGSKLCDSVIVKGAALRF